jgi:hypothetical protein
METRKFPSASRSNKLHTTITRIRSHWHNYIHFNKARGDPVGTRLTKTELLHAHPDQARKDTTMELDMLINSRIVCADHDYLNELEKSLKGGAVMKDAAVQPNNERLSGEACPRGHRKQGPLCCE